MSSICSSSLCSCFFVLSKPCKAFYTSDLNLHVFFPFRLSVYAALARYAETGNHDDRARSWRPRVSTERENRMLVRTSLLNRQMTIPALAASWSAEGVTASKTTVRRRLQDAGLHGRLSVKKPLLTARHRCLRLVFARDHLN